MIINAGNRVVCRAVDRIRSREEIGPIEDDSRQFGLPAIGYRTKRGLDDLVVPEGILQEIPGVYDLAVGAGLPQFSASPLSVSQA